MNYYIKRSIARSAHLIINTTKLFRDLTRTSLQISIDTLQLDSSTASEIKMKYDITIIGGGLAGLSTALYICSKVDAAVVIIDKGRIGDPTKTSPFTFPETVEKYGVKDAVLQTYTKYTYRSPVGTSATWEYSEPVFLTLDYQEVCKNLLTRARKRGNLEVLQNIKVVDFEVNREAFGIKNLTLKLSANEDIETDILVDASGKSFFVAHKFGLSLPSFYSHAYGEILDNCKIEDPNEMHILAGKKYGTGGGWFYPLNGKKARFGIAEVTDSLDYPETTVRKNFLEAYKNFWPYSEMVKNSKTVRSEFGSIPIGAIEKFCSDRILIVGDAAGHATPWFCEGVRPALESGQICGKVIARAYEQQDYSQKTLEKYQEEWDRRNRRRYTVSFQKTIHKWFRTQEEWDKGVKKMSMLTSENVRDAIKYGEVGPTILFSKEERLTRPIIKLINYVKSASTKRKKGKSQQKRNHEGG